jgi:3-oxoacyl-[acyl-carrier protein] reductase
MDLNLKNRTALVTGASRGIGLGVARALAAEGCHLHLCARSEGALKAARQSIIDEFPVKVSCHAFDLALEESAAKLAQACVDVDILINNAGAIPHGSVTSIDSAVWRESWDLKVFGFIALIRGIYGAMCERRGGVIINVIGNNGERPSAARLPASMANAALMAMSHALGAESADYGVRVIGVNPGLTETDRAVEGLRARAEKELGSGERWREVTTALPFGRIGTVPEVADVIAFLASDRASYISGTIVTIDGGGAWRK